jgi:hypothetical protein
VRALELRQNELGSMAGWSLSFMANLWARSGQGERALENLELLLRGCTTPNLLSWGNDWRALGLSMSWGQGALPPFQIEAGMGFVSAVCEMLVRSRPAFCACFPPYQAHGLMEACGESRHGAECRLISPGQNRGRVLSLKLSSPFPNRSHCVYPTTLALPPVCRSGSWQCLS